MLESTYIKLDKLASTKEELRTTINSRGGVVSKATPFSSYPEKIQNLEKPHYVNLKSPYSGAYSIMAGVEVIEFPPNTFCTNLSGLPDLIRVRGTTAIRPCEFTSDKKLSRLDVPLGPPGNITSSYGQTGAFSDCVSLTKVIFTDANLKWYSYLDYPVFEDVSNTWSYSLDFCFRNCPKLELIDMSRWVFPETVSGDQFSSKNKPLPSNGFFSGNYPNLTTILWPKHFAMSSINITGMPVLSRESLSDMAANINQNYGGLLKMLTTQFDKLTAEEQALLNNKAWKIEKV